MSDLHPLLLRQLRRLGLGEDTPPDAAQWQALLGRVSEAYRSVDDERYTTERAFALASQELQDLNKRLEEQSSTALALEHDKLERSHALLSAAMDSMVEALFVVDGAQQVLMLNRRFAELVKLTSDEATHLSGAALFERLVVAMDDRGPLTAAIERLSTQPLESSHDTLYLRDGRILDCYSAPVRGRRGEPRARMWRFVDVTEERQNASALEDAAAVLDAIVIDQRHTERALREALEQAEHAGRAKADFLANMSHELRTPLNAIVGFSRVLHGRAVMDAQQREYVGYIRQASEHMLSLVNDLLDLRRAEASARFIELQVMDVNTACARAVELVKPLIDERRQTLRCDVRDQPLLANGDPRALVQVLTNLLSNAAKFTAEGGALSLSVATDGARVLLSVEDSGRGIAAEDIGKLFTYFSQVGAKHEHNMKGSGVGLALTRALVEGMGGSIAVASELGRGSRFTVNLPAAGAAEQGRVETWRKFS